MGTDTDHQSIGEVLAALRDEFPDVTISKIRFLESQGLIDPERTPSGYRKFRDRDVSRLRWILHQQKDNFLPLKVIKSRLDDAGPDALPPDIEGETDAGDAQQSESAATKSPATEPPPTRTPATKTASTKAPPTKPPATKPKRASRAKSTKRAPAGAAATRTRAPSTAAPTFELQRLPLEPDADPDEDLRAMTTGASFTRKELATAAGLTEVQLSELEEYGLVTPAAGSGARVVFAEDALVVARLASEFAAHGIGPRHLRMFRSFADREAGLYDQVIAPRLRRRNPEARTQAREDLVDLARLGRALRSAFLREATATMLQD